MPTHPTRDFMETAKLAHESHRPYGKAINQIFYFPYTDAIASQEINLSLNPTLNP
ncbi:hypothetical protein [Aetokthonos hydrillicola]|uniref:hypothetical protein n=1 Tax=Aetokthonos hydrillicola TaxID=1550245 RepID=UPI001ABABBC9|nr:hypothetical protein [Aetokthonos hydrillicola]MBO3460103.1 hypothetical protein [Aetokthonos hydrillicola CCALA 1050]